MRPEDVQQMGRILSILSTCIDKLETVMANSDKGSPPYVSADNAAEWVSYALEEVAKTMDYHPSNQFVKRDTPHAHTHPPFDSDE